MRALCLTAVGGPEHLRVLDLPAPVLSDPRDVRIGTRSVALNHLDLWVADGVPAVPIPSLPHVVAADAAGVVLEVGAAVTHVAPGDRVVVNPGIGCGECGPCGAGEEVFCRRFGLLGEHRSGTAAEEIIVPGKNVLPLHGAWSWHEAAAFTLVTITAWRMLVTRARLSRDEVVLIWGIGGGVAQAAMRIAAHRGARIAVTSSSDEKLVRAGELGAELTVNHRTEEDVAGALKRQFGGVADVVVNPVGSPVWDRSLRALRPGGRLVTCAAGDPPTASTDLRRLFWFQWSLLGSTMGTSGEFAEIVALGDAGLLRPQIDAVLPLAEGRRAYRRLAEGRQFGKLVLEVSP
jgi:NADPH:quinone reductase-like Zn-dependent oxidoreductase